MTGSVVPSKSCAVAMVASETMALAAVRVNARRMGLCAVNAQERSVFGEASASSLTAARAECSSAPRRVRVFGEQNVNRRLIALGLFVAVPVAWAQQPPNIGIAP